MKKPLLWIAGVFAVVALAKGLQAIVGDPGQATVSYWGDGRPKNSTTYVDGVKQGRSEQWYSDGSKEWDGQYRDGLREGEWLFWNEDGSLDDARSGEYRDGVRVES